MHGTYMGKKTLDLILEYVTEIRVSNSGVSICAEKAV
jgi:hypothetical protein